MDWNKFDIDGWNCMVDRSTGSVLAFSKDGVRRIECNALDKNWVGMSKTLDTILLNASLRMSYTVC